MPAGTMRFAETGGQEFTKEVTEALKKEKILGAIILGDSSAEKAYRKSIASAL